MYYDKVLPTGWQTVLTLYIRDQFSGLILAYLDASVRTLTSHVIKITIPKIQTLSMVREALFKSLTKSKSQSKHKNSERKYKVLQLFYSCCRKMYIKIKVDRWLFRCYDYPYTCFISTQLARGHIFIKWFYPKPYNSNHFMWLSHRY